MPKAFIGFALFGLLVLGALMAWSLSQIGSGSQEAEGEIPLSDISLYEDIQAPNAELINEFGETVSLTSEVSGDGYTVLSFVFTHCELVCPIMNGNVYRLTQELAGQPVKFVGVSVDPVNDTPERLREYLATFDGVAPGVWTMLTGPEGVSDAIVRSMGFVLEEDQSDANIIKLPNGETMRNIVHPVRFLIFDPEGRVVGSYRGNNPEEVDQLGRDLKRVLASRGLLS